MILIYVCIDIPQSRQPTDSQRTNQKSTRTRGGKPTTSKSISETCKGDQQMVNIVNFMRMTFWYREFCNAIAEGDTGRVHEILKVCISP